MKLKDSRTAAQLYWMLRKTGNFVTRTLYVEQVRMYNVMGQELGDAAAYAHSGRFMCTHQMAALFCLAAIMNVWRQIENPMCIYLKFSAKFYPDPIWNDGTFGFCEDDCPNKKTKMISDMGSVPGPETHKQ